ncbi:polyprenyl synthetase family protein [Devosia albogilva]|uniref:Polyprenyl synthetase family protein n=1 Tax=Devosia albogilva TaxID=429726 RepID=A0ABW5QHX9_9HYPH
MSLTSIELSNGVGRRSDIAVIRARLETKLAELLETGPTPANLKSAMDHALLAPSKRLRPILLYLVSEPDDCLTETALCLGAAVEMVHTASLILDDLPCMDDADMRRERPTTHKAFGQATAILSAIGLLTRAFGIIAELAEVPAATRTRLAAVLATASGHQGLVAGQEIDLNARETLVDQEQIENLNWLKTGSLFVAAAEMGAILRDLPGNRVEHVRRFARHLGLAFQTADDLLDKTASTSEIGKDTLKDGDKATLVSLFGARRARLTCNEHLQAAERALLDSGVSVGPIQAVMDTYLRAKIGSE